jgi:hypothetical protein
VIGKARYLAAFPKEPAALQICALGSSKKAQSMPASIPKKTDSQYCQPMLISLLGLSNVAWARYSVVEKRELDLGRSIKHESHLCITSASDVAFLSPMFFLCIK